MSNKKLSKFQQVVYDVLAAKRGKDVPIDDLYKAAYGELEPELFSGWTNRRIQQRMGPLFSRINDKLPRHKIEPGDLKRTYRLVSTTKVK